MNVLIIAAHPDDELLGCGGTVRKLADEGHVIYSCILCSTANARHNRPDLEKLREYALRSSRMIGVQDSVGFDFDNIALNSVPHLDVVRAMESAILRFRPEWIFTHHPGDLNIDHQVCYHAAMAACHLPQRLSTDLPPHQIKKIMLCEIPSSTDWTTMLDPAFVPNLFVDISATIDTKMEALDLFEGALKPYPHSRSAENLRNLAKLRGARVGLEYAEAFITVRDVLV